MTKRFPLSKDNVRSLILFWRGHIEFENGWQDKGRRKLEGERRLALTDRRQQEARKKEADRRKVDRRGQERRGTSGREFFRHDDPIMRVLRQHAEPEVEGPVSTRTTGPRTSAERKLPLPPVNRQPADVSHAKVNPSRTYPQGRGPSPVSPSGNGASQIKKHPEDTFVPIQERIGQGLKAASQLLGKLRRQPESVKEEDKKGE